MRASAIACPGQNGRHPRRLACPGQIENVTEAHETHCMMYLLGWDLLPLRPHRIVRCSKPSIVSWLSGRQSPPTQVNDLEDGVVSCGACLRPPKNIRLIYLKWAGVSYARCCAVGNSVLGRQALRAISSSAYGAARLIPFLQRIGRYLNSSSLVLGCNRGCWGFKFSRCWRTLTCT
jgi:hypothetical protein